MDPKEIAKLITEDPDIMSEGYCQACGGWDIKQGGRGHNVGCSVGKPFTPISHGTPTHLTMWDKLKHGIETMGLNWVDGTEDDVEGTDGIPNNYKGPWLGVYRPNADGREDRIANIIWINNEPHMSNDGDRGSGGTPLAIGYDAIVEGIKELV